MANDFYSVTELVNTKFKTFDFDGKWLDSFGKPECRGTWLVWGESFNGKSTLVAQLAKYLTDFVKNKVLINSLEEGKSESFKLNMVRNHLDTVSDKILLGNKVPMDKIAERLRKQRSPEIIIIDSLQYADLDKPKFKKLVDEFSNKLWIFISQADGKIPRGMLARHLRNHADVKIRVEGFKAFVESRYGGGEEYIINHERASKYWGEIE